MMITFLMFRADALVGIVNRLLAKLQPIFPNCTEARIVECIENEADNSGSLNEDVLLDRCIELLLQPPQPAAAAQEGKQHFMTIDHLLTIDC